MALIQSIKQYIQSAEIPPEITPKAIEKLVRPNIILELGMEERKALEAKEAPAQAASSQPINGAIFLAGIKKLGITGKEFLSLLGNSRISNEAFSSIEHNSKLTYEELKEIIQKSSLTSDDFHKLLSAANEISKQKKLMREQKESQKTSEYEISECENVSPSDYESDNYNIEPQKENFNENVEKYKNDLSNIKINFNIDDYDSDEDELYHPVGTNNFKITAMVFLALILILCSFLIRYFNTGSFFPELENMAVSSKNIDVKYEDIIENLKIVNPASQNLQNNFYISPSVSKPLLSTVLAYKEQLFYISENKLFIIDTLGEQNKTIKIIEEEGLSLAGIFIHDEKLALLYENACQSLTATKNIIDAEENETTITRDLNKNGVFIDFYDLQNFENKKTRYFQGGIFTDIFINKDKICLITEDCAIETNSDFIESFSPWYGFNDQLSFAEVTVGIGATEASLTVISVISPEDSNVECTSISGGKKTVVSHKEDTVILLKESGMQTIAANYKMVENSFEFISQVSLSGTPDYNFGVLENENIRIVLSENGGASLYILNQKLEIISSIKGLAAKKELTGTAFSENNSYLITEDTIYGISHTDIKNPVILKEISEEIHSKNLTEFSNGFLEITPTANNGGERTGLSLNYYDKDLKKVSEATIQIEESYNKYIFSPAEKDASLLFAGENFAAVPVSYFDGVSEVLEYCVYSLDNENKFKLNGSVKTFNPSSKKQNIAFSNNKLYGFMGTEMFVFSPETAAVSQKITIK